MVKLGCERWWKLLRLFVGASQSYGEQTLFMLNHCMTAIMFKLMHFYQGKCHRITGEREAVYPSRRRRQDSFCWRRVARLLLGYTAVTMQ